MALQGTARQLVSRDNRQHSTGIERHCRIAIRAASMLHHHLLSR